MRSIFVLAFVSLISTVPGAFAASMSVPSPTPTPGSQELRCRFEGRDSDQNEGLRCYVRISLCPSAMAPQPGDAQACGTRSERDAFEVRCTNGYELESRDYAVGRDRDSVWINADERGRLATLRLKLEAGMQERSEGNRADLLITNRVARHLEGRCRLVGENTPGNSLDEFLN